jgi:hypothetical protein
MEAAAWSETDLPHLGVITANIHDDALEAAGEIISVALSGHVLPPIDVPYYLTLRAAEDAGM